MIATMSTTRFPSKYLEEDIGTSLFITCIVFLVLETVFMILMYTSRYLAKGERPNKSMEIFMTMTYFVCIGKITIMILLVKIGGTGRHRIVLSPSTIQTSLKLSTATQIVCPLTTSLSKLGVLCLFHRIIGQSSRRYRIIIRATFGIVLVIMIAQALIPFVNCFPFSKMWNPQGPGTCAIESLSLWRYLSTPNVFTTLIVVAIPLPTLAKLQVSRSVKLGFVAVFAVCVLGVVAAIMRLRAFLQVTDFQDITFENVRALQWTVAESGLYLVAGTMLTLKPLLKRFFEGAAIEKLLSRGSRNSTTSEGRRGSRRWHRYDPQAQLVDVKKQRSSSDITSEGIAIGKLVMPGVCKTNE